MKEIKKEIEIIKLNPEVDKETFNQHASELLSKIYDCKEEFEVDCDDKKLFKLYDELIKYIKANTYIEKQMKTEYRHHALEEIKEECGKDFIAEMTDLFKNNYCYHSTNVYEVDDFFEKGFFIYGSSELASTTYRSNGSIENILYNLFNRSHLGFTRIVVLDATQEDVNITGDVGAYVLGGIISKENVKAYIDLENKKIYYNPHYKERLVNGKNTQIDSKKQSMCFEAPKPEHVIMNYDNFNGSIMNLDTEICSIYGTLMDAVIELSNEYEDTYYDKYFLDECERGLEIIKKIDIESLRKEYAQEMGWNYNISR